MADYNYIMNKHNIVFASKPRDGTIAIHSWAEMDAPLILTPLFSTFIGNNIQLLARDANAQYMITLTDIQYWFYFAIPPTCEKDTQLRELFDKNIIEKYIHNKYPKLTIEEENIIDAESF